MIPSQPKGWLEPLVQILDNDGPVAAVGSKLLFPDGTIQHAGVIVVDDKKDSIPLCPWHVHYRQPGHLAAANQAKTYQALTAASLLVRKKAFEDLLGFDEEYWNGYEDVDLCFKLRGKGLEACIPARKCCDSLRIKEWARKVQQGKPESI